MSGNGAVTICVIAAIKLAFVKTESILTARQLNSGASENEALWLMQIGRWKNWLFHALVCNIRRAVQGPWLLLFQCSFFAFLIVMRAPSLLTWLHALPLSRAWDTFYRHAYDVLVWWWCMRPRHVGKLCSILLVLSLVNPPTLSMLRCGCVCVFVYMCVRVCARVCVYVRLSVYVWSFSLNAVFSVNVDLTGVCVSSGMGHNLPTRVWPCWRGDCVRARAASVNFDGPCGLGGRFTGLLDKSRRSNIFCSFCQKRVNFTRITYVCSRSVSFLSQSKKHPHKQNTPAILSWALPHDFLGN